MFKNLKIGVGFKITLLVITVVSISVITVGYVAFNLSKKSIEERYRESLRVVSVLKTQKIEAFFEKIKANIQFGSQLKVVKNKLSSYNLDNALASDTNRKVKPNVRPVNLNKKDPKNNLKVEDQKIKKQNQPKLKNDTTNIELANDSESEVFLGENEELNDLVANVLTNYEIKTIYLTDKDGKVLFNRGKESKAIKNGLPFADKDGNTIVAGRDSVYFSHVFRIDNDFLMHISAPVKADNERDLLGIIIYEIKLKYIYDLVNDTTGLGTTGEIILTKSFGSQISYLNNPRRENSAEFALKRVVYLNTNKEIAIQNSTKKEGKEDYVYDVDYQNNEVLATWHFIPVIEWGIVVKVDTSEIYAPTYKLASRLATTALIIFLVSLFIGVAFSQRTLISPLILLKETVNLIAKGVLPDKIQKKNEVDDEIGEMTGKLNELVENLKTKANFARSIGKGDFEADFKPISNRDTLGIALLSMRDSIQQSAERDDERNWIVQGLAEIGDNLPSVATIDELGELVCEFTTNKIGAVQSAFYVVNDQMMDNKVIELKTSYAYNKRKYLKAQFKFAEGLVGQAAAEQDTILRTEIPDEYLTISSGILGDQKPKCILITPLITNETVYGVLEFAGFQRFANREIDFVKEISEIIARTVFNIKVRENTERLLRESQKMSAELQSREEVLRQNAEIMEATSEELQRTNKELETQVREVQRANDRTQLLLENASEVITIYEPDGTIRYISPSVIKILGYTQDEMIGIKDVVYVHPLGVEAYEEMFKELVDNPEESITTQFSYLIKTGERIWLEATGTNRISDPSIQGIVMNVRDITERREAEKEQRLRGQMQALSENSPDLITRITKEGKVVYINPIIETYSGKNKENYLMKSMQELELGDSILNSWNEIMKDVFTKNQKMSLDMDFPSIMGDRVMQVNAIPEYNEQNNMESVLLVSHDITERKIIELEISQKSRKITESINYAKRIQEAILPDTSYIRQFLENSFILYKPRDIVSGDFPWFLQKGDDIFIAAVDCTGHGVPGALISLIGYFLLNNIVNIQQASSPGEILELLDEEVTKTLRQDESDASTKDGMDISLCKINRRKMQIEYAGAHRPLYYMIEEDLLEIRGNKFPIGGAQYKNRGRFTNTIINYKAGDSVYLFSDGYPDQFGGPKNKKFSPRRIRNIIKENEHLEIQDLSRLLDKEFENWKGNNKQTDDVLIIGIKF